LGRSFFVGGKQFWIIANEQKSVPVVAWNFGHDNAPRLYCGRAAPEVAQSAMARRAKPAKQVSAASRIISDLESRNQSDHGE
jgi:hypothetical protein